jgi:hypothetical protein
VLKTVAKPDFPFGFSVGGAAVKVSPGKAMSSGLDQKLGVTTRLASGELDCEPAELVEVADADDDDVARSLTFPAPRSPACVKRRCSKRLCEVVVRI